MSEYWVGDYRTKTTLHDHAQQVLEPCSLEGHRYQFDPYVGCAHQCCYCYALVRNSNGWNREVEWYDNMAQRLAAELQNIEPQAIYMGWYSDPYQPVEVETRLTRNALSQLVQNRFAVTILTKSTLVERDIDLLTKMPDSFVGVSLSFIDEKIRSLFEAGTCETALRIAVLQKLRAAGIKTYALVCPVIPFVTDTESIIRTVAPYADSVWVCSLRIRDEQDQNWQNVLAVLKTHFPVLMGQVTDAVLHSDHPFWTRQRTELTSLAAKMQLNLQIDFA